MCRLVQISFLSKSPWFRGFRARLWFISRYFAYPTKKGFLECAWHWLTLARGWATPATPAADLLRVGSECAIYCDYFRVCDLKYPFFCRPETINGYLARVWAAYPPHVLWGVKDSLRLFLSFCPYESLTPTEFGNTILNSETYLIPTISDFFNFAMVRFCLVLAKPVEI